MTDRQPQRADSKTIALSVAGILVLVVCFVVVLTQDDPTIRTIAIVATIALWFLLRFTRRSRT